MICELCGYLSAQESIFQDFEILWTDSKELTNRCVTVSIPVLVERVQTLKQKRREERGKKKRRKQEYSVACHSIGVDSEARKKGEIEDIPSYWKFNKIKMLNILRWQEN